ncbi:MAG: hypothetical protein HZA49_00080 [Planctomycetes bacterium]|nr:hypothetical protein [Planctomycetota bacterium]
MRNKLLTGGAIALILCLGGLLLMANPNAKPPATKPPAGKPAPETKPAPEAKKPDAPPSKDGDVKAKKAFTDALEKRNKAKGYHFNGKRETLYVEMGMPIPASFEGVKNNTENLLYMVYETKVMSGPQRYELYQKGDKKYTRNVASEERAEGKAPSPILQGDRLATALEGYKFGKDEKIEEVDYAVIEATIKEEGASKLISELPMPLPAEAKLTCDKSGFRIWVDKKTSLISKMVFFVEVSARMPGSETPEEGQEAPAPSGRKVSVDINITDYDKDIDITVPDEIKEVLDAKDEPEEK